MQTSQNTRNVTQAAHVQGVNATSSGLVKATLGAALTAGAILTFVWLPAEHGIDPTGVGHVLGLTEMGHIKEQLHLEADADAADAADAEAAALRAQSDESILQKLDAMQAQLTAIEKTIGANASTNSAQAPAPVNEQSAGDTSEVGRYEDNYTLAPGQGIEVKLVMDKGAVAEFEWNANGSVVNHDTHGDGLDNSISYKQGRAVSGESGKLTAAFNGNHGWFWRNRTEQDVVITLRTRGDYKGIIPP